MANATNQASTFQAKFDLYKKWSNLIILPLGAILFGITCYHFTGLLCFVTVVVLLLGLLPNCLWFVPTGYVGILTYFGTQRKRSYRPGVPCLKLPLVCGISFLEVREQEIKLKDTNKKTNTRNKLENFEGLFTYTLDEKTAHWLVSRLGEDYKSRFLEKWVDASIDTVVGKLVYAHFQGKKPEVEDWMTKIIQYTIALEMSKNTEAVCTESFNTIAYTLEPVRHWIPNPDKDPANPADASKPSMIEIFEYEDIIVNAERGETERVVKLELVETPVTLNGVNPFEKVSLRINSIVFEKAYEDGKAGVKAAEANLEKERRNAEATRVKAEAAAAAKLKIAEAEAKATRLLTESLGGDAAAAAQIIAAKAMSGLQGTYVQGGGAGVVVQGGKPKP